MTLFFFFFKFLTGLLTGPPVYCKSLGSSNWQCESGFPPDPWWWREGEWAQLWFHFNKTFIWHLWWWQNLEVLFPRLQFTGQTTNRCLRCFQQAPFSNTHSQARTGRCLQNRGCGSCCSAVPTMDLMKRGKQRFRFFFLHFIFFNKKIGPICREWSENKLRYGIWYFHFKVENYILAFWMLQEEKQTKIIIFCIFF